MQNYIDIATKNGVILHDSGACQFCGANTKRGIHECVELFSLGFQVLDFTIPEHHLYRFISVDAHTLQHPEIHGRWNNHFHLTRLHLMLTYNIEWNYKLSPELSDYLDRYKVHNQSEFLVPPLALKRGTITTTDILHNSSGITECQNMIIKWGNEVYRAWSIHHLTADHIAQGFIKRNKSQLRSDAELYRY